MLTPAQADAIREYIALEEPIRRLVILATTDLYHGPIHRDRDEDDDPWPGFAAACAIIRDAIPSSDLFIDTDADEVIGDSEPDFAESVVRVDSRLVRRVLVGSTLARYI